MIRLRHLAFAVLLAAPSASRAQGVPPEIAELRRRVSVLRTNMPAITEAAEYAAGLFTRDTSYRFLVSIKNDPAMRLELYWHAGGPPETSNADDGRYHGVVMNAVRSWEGGGGIGTAMMVDQMAALGRPVITIGSAVGKPNLPVGSRFIDNGAPDGSAAHADMNKVADIVAVWTFYSEFIAAATRRGWQPGVYLSILAPGNERHNNSVHFRMPRDATPVPVIPAGKLGNEYLVAVDSIVTASALPAHVAQVRLAADSLIAMRKGGARLWAASCGHFLQEDILNDTKGSPFRTVDWRWDVPQKLASSGIKRDDAMVWFGYAGYDCPLAEVAAPFADAGLRVVLVSDKLAPGNTPGRLVAQVKLSWQIPDAAAKLPFAPGGVGPTSSVDMELHYIWLRRLLNDQ